MLCAFSGPLSQWDVCLSVFPARSSSLSGAPVSLPSFSSLGCDCSQLTPQLLWQPKNSLEKGQLAALALCLPRALNQCCGVWAPSTDGDDHNGPRNQMFLVTLSMYPLVHANTQYSRRQILGSQWGQWFHSRTSIRSYVVRYRRGRIRQSTFQGGKSVSFYSSWLLEKRPRLGGCFWNLS